MSSHKICILCEKHACYTLSDTTAFMFKKMENFYCQPQYQSFPSKEAVLRKRDLYQIQFGDDQMTFEKFCYQFGIYCQGPFFQPLIDKHLELDKNYLGILTCQTHSYHLDKSKGIPFSKYFLGDIKSIHKKAKKKSMKEDLVALFNRFWKKYGTHFIAGVHYGSLALLTDAMNMPQGIQKSHHEESVAECFRKNGFCSK